MMKSIRIEVYRDNLIDLYLCSTEEKVRIHFIESVRPLKIKTSEVIFLEKKQTQECYLVWNKNYDKCFVTVDPQLAYEARKGSDSNCFHQDGTKCEGAVMFCNETENDTCKIEHLPLK